MRGEFWERLLGSDQDNRLTLKKKGFKKALIIALE
jgi:hypothetical protein